MKVQTRISGARASRGFTLLELLLVCALIALAAGLVGSFLSGNDQKQFSSNLRQVSAQLRYSRRQAIVSGAEQEVRLATLLVEPDAPDEPLPRPPDWFNQDMQLRYAPSLDDALEETDELSVTFFPMGSSTGGLIGISYAEREAFLYISPLTGKLIIENALTDIEERVGEEAL